MSTFPPAPHGGLLRHLALHLAFGVTAGIMSLPRDRGGPAPRS